VQHKTIYYKANKKERRHKNHEAKAKISEINGNNSIN
jgi:hypothetical protein